MTKKEYQEKRAGLLQNAEAFLNAGDLENFEAKKTEIEALDAQYEEYGKAMTNLNALRGPGVGSENPLAPEGGTVVSVGAVESGTDPFASLEYRKAFMDYCQTGAVNPKFNEDAFAGVTEAGAVIPTTILQEVIREAKQYGQLFSRVRQTNVKGGMNVPISSLRPTATWIGEDASSDRKKVDLSTKVSFSYFGLECKISISLLADVTTLEIFEQTIRDILAEAIAEAMDKAIIAGTGSDKPTGITVDSRVAAGQKITLSSAEFTDWSAWKKKVFGKIPLAYRAGGTFIMAAGTFEGYIDGMVDANGQPIGRTTHNITNGSQEKFGGKEVLLVEDDVVKPYDAADAGDVVAVFCRLKDYCVNSNMKVMMMRWLDPDKNEYVDKAIVIVDGKLLDAKGVILVKKGA